MYIYKKNAFTLAEVLITLGIIGIVAALTMPALIANFKMKSYEVQFKKQYSILQNAINQAVFENGMAYNCPTGAMAPASDTNECFALRDAVLAKLKIVKKCPRLSACNPFTKGLYKTRDIVLAEGGTTSNSSCTFNFANNSGANFLADGSILYTGEQYNAADYIFAIDINGEKPPNKWGYDLFIPVPVMKNDNNILGDGTCQLYEKGGKKLSQMLSN